MSMTPEQHAKLAAFKEVKVKHARLNEVDRAVTRAIDEHASYTQLLLYGPSGAGKSTIAKRITERCLEQEPNRAIVPVVLVEAHSSDIGAYAPGLLWPGSGPAQRSCGGERSLDARSVS